MKASTKRIFSILISILMLIGSLFVYASLIKPAYSEIKGLRAEVVSRLDFIATNETYIQEVQKVLTEYQNAAMILEVVSLALPLKQDVASAINQLAGLSANNKLMIESLDVQQLSIKPSTQSKLVKGVGTLRFNFRLLGSSYENFKSFLQALETNITLMDLVNLKIESIQKPKGGLSDFYYTMTMTVDTYYQAE